MARRLHHWHRKTETEKGKMMRRELQHQSYVNAIGMVSENKGVQLKDYGVRDFIFR